MQKKFVAKVITFIIIFTLVLFYLTGVSMAAGFSASSAKSSLTVGDTTTLTITASDCGGKFSITSSDSSIVGVATSPKWIENTSSSITLSAKKAGTATITVTATDVADTSGDNAITGSKKITITVKEQVNNNTNSNTTTNTNTNTNSGTNNTAPIQTKSSDATLKSIKVGNKTYSKPGSTVTASNVSAGTSSIKITAETNNSKAKVTGTGTKDLVTGTNKFTLKVTAEDGSTKNYTVKVTKLAEENQTPNVIESSSTQSENKEENGLGLESLEIEGLNIFPGFKRDIYEYTAGFHDLDSLNVKAVANNENAKIEITGNENLVEGDNIIYIVVTLNDKTVTYKITANKAAGLTNTNYSDEAEKTEEIIPNNETKTKVSFIGSIKDWWKNGGNLIIVFAIIWIMMGAAIVYAVIAYRYAKILKDEYGYSFSNNVQEYGYDLDEDIETSNQELEEWYTNPENDIENISKTKGRHF